MLYHDIFDQQHISRHFEFKPKASIGISEGLEGVIEQIGLLSERFNSCTTKDQADILLSHVCSFLDGIMFVGAIDQYQRKDLEDFAHDHWHQCLIRLDLW